MPLWCPEILAGTEGLAEPCLGLLHPLHQLLRLFSPTAVLKLESLLHMVLLFCGVYLFAGLWVQKKSTAVLASVFALMSFLHREIVVWGHLTILTSLALYPWALYALHRMVVEQGRRKLAWACGLGLLIGISWICGHPQYQFICCELGALYFLGLIKTRHGRWLGPEWLYGAGAVLAGLLVGLPQIAATVEEISHSFRFSLSGNGEFLFSGSLSPYQLLKWLSPLVYGSPEVYIGPRNFWFGQCFNSAGVLMLCILGFFRLPRWMMMLPAVGLLLSLGENTPLYSLYLHLVPGANLFRYASRYMHGLLPFLALAFACGVERARAERCGRVWVLFIAAGLLLPLLPPSLPAGLVAIFPQHYAEHLSAARWPDPLLLGAFTVEGLVAMALCLGEGATRRAALPALLACHLLISWLLPFSGRTPEPPNHQPSAPNAAPPERIQILEDRSFHNFCLESGDHGIAGYRTLLPCAYRNFLDTQSPQNWHKLNRVQTGRMNPAGLSFLGVGRIYERLDGNFRPAGPLAVDRPPLPRYYLAAGFNELPLRSLSPWSEPIHEGQEKLEHEFARFFSLPVPPPLAGGGVQILAYRREEVLLRAHCDGPAFLASSENSDPLWRLEVDGQNTPIRPWYGAFRGAFLASGDHEIRFYVDRGPFNRALLIAVSTAMLLLVAGLYSFSRSRTAAA